MLLGLYFIINNAVRPLRQRPCKARSNPLVQNQDRVLYKTVFTYITKTAFPKKEVDFVKF